MKKIKELMTRTGLTRQALCLRAAKLGIEDVEEMDIIEEARLIHYRKERRGPKIKHMELQGLEGAAYRKAYYRLFTKRLKNN